MVEEPSLLIDIQEHYQYVVEGKVETIVLPVDSKDVILNADGEVDCPFDTVLRKNHYSYDDLNKWAVKEIRFIQIKNDVETVVQRIQMNVNL